MEKAEKIGIEDRESLDYIYDIEELINRHGNDLLRLCYMYLKDYYLAQDAVQDTFVKIFKKAHTFRGECSVKTWISGIAINVCKDYMRKRSFSEIASDEIAVSGAQYSDAIIDAIKNEERAEVLAGVMALPEIYREVILLFYYSGLTTAEISKATGINIITVRTRMSRGRTMLKLSLRGLNNENT